MNIIVELELSGTVLIDVRPRMEASGERTAVIAGTKIFEERKVVRVMFDVDTSVVDAEIEKRITSFFKQFNADGFDVSEIKYRCVLVSGGKSLI